MTRTYSFSRPLPIVLLLIAALVLPGCAVWRLGESRTLAKMSEPFQASPPRFAGSLLVVGDSTAVGTGASSGITSVAGLIARDHPELKVVNRAEDGARLADVVRQLEQDGSLRFDTVLIQAGGNDVIRLTPYDRMQNDVSTVLDLAIARARVVIVMPSGNVGNAPFFFAPVSWLMASRSRELHRVVRQAAGARGAIYVNLYREKADDPFALQPAEFNARDGLHPSDVGYQFWYRELESQAHLSARLWPNAKLAGIAP